MNRFVEFNPAKFLKESKGWEKELKKLREQLDSVTNLSSPQIDGMPHGTDVGNPTMSKALEMYELTEKIKRLERYVAIWEWVKSQLDDMELEVIEAFFYKGGYVHYNVDQFAHKHHMSVATVYLVRRRALDHMTELVTERVE